MSYVEMLGHLTFIALAASFLVKDIIYLRVLSMVSCFAAIFYNFYGFASPVWLVIFWQIIFILINTVQIGLLFREKREINFNEEEQELHETLFSNMSPVEFMKFMRIAKWENIGAKTVVIEEQQPLSSIILIYNGIVEVQKKKQHIATAKDGTFLGDMEFFAEPKASATATSVTDLRIVVWPLTALKKMLKLNPTILISLNSALSISLAKKLANSTCAEG
jgi:hypothetical protein